MDDNGMECESDVEKPDGASSSHGTPLQQAHWAFATLMMLIW